MKKTKILFILIFSFCLKMFSQNTSIPDANFEQALIDLGLDSAPIDGMVPTSNISSLTTLNLINKSISDLTGIEDFAGLTTLRLSNNAITSLDVSQNTNLNVLVTDNNQLSSMDLSQNTMLYEFISYDNQLTSVILPNSIRIVNLRNNLFTSLDFSSLTNLTSLICRNNPLESLNVKNGVNNILQKVISWNDTSYPNGSPLECIEVDNSGDANARIGYYALWEKKSHVTYAESCSNPKTWTGDTDTNWNTASNWDGGIPDSSSFVTIANTASVPTISGGIAANVGTLYIETGANLTVGANSSITISNSVNNQGNLTIESSGSIIAKNAISTNIEYKRQVTDGWHLISIPVNDLDINEFSVTNVATNAIATNGSNYGVATYNNNANTWAYYNTGNIAGAGSFISGKGYSALRTSIGNFSFAGLMPTTDVSIEITDGAANEWNLIGNPYPSYVPVNNFADPINNILVHNMAVLHPSFQAIYIWNSLTGSYVAVNHASPPRYMAPGQGFFVRSIENGGNSTFNFTENMQSHQANDVFNRTTSNHFHINISLSNGNKNKSTDIKYINNTTKGLDPGYDAGSFDSASDDLNIYSHLLANSKEIGFALQCLPAKNFENMVVPLGVNANVGDQLVFSINVFNIPSSLHIYLEDRLLNIFTRLDTNNSNYRLTTYESIKGIGRFYLHTKYHDPSKSSDNALNNIRVFMRDYRELLITGLKDQVSIRIYDLLGKKVLDRTVFDNTIKIPERIAPGMYIVHLASKGYTINSKITIE